MRFVFEAQTYTVVGRDGDLLSTAPCGHGSVEMGELAGAKSRQGSEGRSRTVRDLPHLVFIAIGGSAWRRPTNTMKTPGSSGRGEKLGTE